MDVNDFYGFSLDPVFGNVLYASAGYDPITEKDGVFSVDLSDARMTEIIEKCAGIFGEPGRHLSQQVFGWLVTARLPREQEHIHDL